MYWLWICITAFLGELTLVCLAFTIALAIVRDINFLWALFATIIFGVALYCSVRQVESFESERRPKCTTISTSTLPKVDTTITYTTGKVDTIYTYKFLNED